MTSKNTSRSSRSTVGTATETSDYLRLLFAKIGHVFCRKCGQEVRRDTPQSAAETLAALPAGHALHDRLSAASCRRRTTIEQLAAALREDGFVRAIVDGRLVNLAEEPLAADRRGEPAMPRQPSATAALRRRRSPRGRQRQPTTGSAIRWKRPSPRGAAGATCSSTSDRADVRRRRPQPLAGNSARSIDGRPWRRLGFSTQLACEDCGIEYPAPEPRLYSFNSPLGACPECEGFGNVIGIDMDLVVPDPGKSLRDGAIAPWNTPAYAHELKELLALAGDYDLPVDVPFRELDRAAAAT